MACEDNRGCGAGLFTRLLPDAPCEVTALNPHGLPVDSRVIIGLPEMEFLSGAFYLYAWPLIGLFAGVFAGIVVAGWLAVSQDLAVLAGAVAGVGLAFSVRRKSAPGMTPVVLRLLN